MDTSLSKIQLDMVKEARRFFKKECPMDTTREICEQDNGFDNQLWSKMVEMDWMGILIPEQYGGLQMQQLDINLLLEEMGRVLLPGPYFSTIMLAAEAIIQGGNQKQKKKYLPAICDGQLKGTLALHEPDSGLVPEFIEMPVTRDGDDYILNGVKLAVPDAHIADFIICAARSSDGDNATDGISLFIVDPKEAGVSIKLLPAMDITRKICAVTFEKVRIPADKVLGEAGNGWPILQKVLKHAQIGMSAESIGGAQRAMELAVDYAKGRVQFDHPIGSYQVIKHLCADMLLEVESARSLLYWAAWAVDQEDIREAALAASTAKAYCTEIYCNITGKAVQVFGGMGVTWEHDIHLYLKRAKANEQALGDPIYHRERIATLLNE